MSAGSRISKAFDHALCLPLDCRSRYILLSDCHRGTGNANDNFLKNEFLYLAALNEYFRRGFTYLELGDGDELWENRSFGKIGEMHRHSFDLIEKFDSAGRFYAVYGNHDMVKKCAGFQEKYSHPYYPGIILKDAKRRTDIYLTHGHQADLLNSTFWRLSRFLVRYVWKPLEGIGVPDPTSAAKNVKKKNQSERALSDWAKQNRHILITGHTHHPMAGTKESPYLNTGSCIHPSGITGIEIENRCLTLVKWSVGTRADLSFCASREILGETLCVDEWTL